MSHPSAIPGPFTLVALKPTGSNTINDAGQKELEFQSFSGTAVGHHVKGLGVDDVTQVESVPLYQATGSAASGKNKIRLSGIKKDGAAVSYGEAVATGQVCLGTPARMILFEKPPCS